MGVRRRGSRLRRAVRAHRRGLRGPAARGHAPPGGQDRRQAVCRGGGRAGRRLESHSGGDGRRRRRGRPRDRVPGHDQGPGGRRRAWHPCRRLRGGAGPRVRACARRGTALLRRCLDLHRAPRHGRAPRRGSDHRRRPRHRMGSGRARLLDPAPQPEGDRGIELPRPPRRAGTRAAGRRRQAGRVGRLPQCRDRRVSLPARGEELRVPRGQPPPPGGAPGHGNDDRPGPREAAAPRGPRRAS